MAVFCGSPVALLSHIHECPVPGPQSWTQNCRWDWWGFPWAHSQSLSRALWMASLPSNTSVATQLGVISELAEGALDPSINDTLMKAEKMLLVPVHTLEGNNLLLVTT